MKKSRPKNRPVKRRVPREKQVPRSQVADAIDTLSATVGMTVRTVNALVDIAGREAVRQAMARLAAAQSLGSLGNYVAQGKLVETRAVTPPATCAVEFSEVNADGAVLTPSVVAELASIEPEMAALFAGKAAGDSFEARGVTIRVLRAWDVVQAVTP